MAEGQARARGELDAEKNPAAPARGGVSFESARVTARYQDGAVTLTVGGSAGYGDGLTAGTAREVEDVDGRVAAALAAVLEAHAGEIEADAMEAAYEARALARRRGDEGV
jgi:hypothetical protein